MVYTKCKPPVTQSANLPPQCATKIGTLRGYRRRRRSKGVNGAKGSQRSGLARQRRPFGAPTSAVWRARVGPTEPSVWLGAVGERHRKTLNARDVPRGTLGKMERGRMKDG